MMWIGKSFGVVRISVSAEKLALLCILPDEQPPHCVIEILDGRLAVGMRQLNGVSTQRFNRRHARVGHVFQGRYKAILVDR